MENIRKYIPNQMVLYGLCGGANLVLDWVLYFLIYNFVIGHDNVHLTFDIGHWTLEQVITPHIATLCVVFPITLLTGFLLQKYITFRPSEVSHEHSAISYQLSGWRQLLRYMMIVGVNLAINYFGLKLCVEGWGWYPTPSKMAITLVTVAISFLGQKYYTFRSERVKSV